MGDDDSDDNDFLRFQWDIHMSGSSTDEGTANKKDKIATQSNDADLLQELLSQLEIGEAAVGDDDSFGSDLQSAVRRIDSPFLGQEEEKQSRRCGCIICKIIDLRRRNNTVRHYMGTMSQCRGAGGDALREAGAIAALLSILWRLRVPMQVQNINITTKSNCSSLISLPKIMPTEEQTTAFDLESLCDNHLHLRNDNSNFDGIAVNGMDMIALDLATSCLASLRDLLCGSALNRAAVLKWTPPASPDECNHNMQLIKNGVHLLCAYVQRYDKCKWEDILSLQDRVHYNGNGSENDKTTDSFTTTYTERGNKELRLLTNALGAIRNTSHSTPDVCQECFNYGLVNILVWRLMPDDDTDSSQLPDASSPWREACFRAAGSLINLAEKCPNVAYQLGSNRRLVYLLVETWGGASAIDPNNKNVSSSIKSLPVLHLGLAAILHAAGDGGALEGGLDGVMVQILEKERVRKRVAQRREEERKQQHNK